MAYLGRQPVLGNFVKLDAITVVNGQAAYTMQNGGVNFTSYDNVNQFLVSLNGILQSPTDSFTVSGSTLTFASNLSTGDVIDFVMVLGNTLDVGTPSDNTVSLAKLTATGTKDATTFLRGDNTFAEVPAGGITSAHQWRLTTNFSGSSDITSNLEQVDSDGYGGIGSVMSQSSGVFTFPATGVWLITAQLFALCNGANRAHLIAINTTTNNSSFDTGSTVYTSMYNSGNDTYANASCSFIFDVTDTSTHKVRFGISTDNGSSVTVGNTNQNATAFTFIRLGDT